MYTRRGQLSKQIFDAVIYENIPQLKNLINRGVGIDTPSIDGGKQVLHIACEHKKSVPFTAIPANFVKPINSHIYAS